jgi:hypothetical protein
MYLLCYILLDVVKWVCCCSVLKWGCWLLASLTGEAGRHAVHSYEPAYVHLSLHSAEQLLSNETPIRTTQAATTEVRTVR